MKRLTIICAAVLAFSAARAADNDAALPFVRIQRDPVRAAFGGSGYAIKSSIAYASWNNAAGIPFSLEKFEFSAGYQYWEPHFSRTHAVSAGAGWNISKKIGVALGATYGICPSYLMAGEDGSAGKMFRPSELQANLGLSWRFVDFLSIGANVHYASQTLMPSYRLYAIYSDIFLMGSISGFTITAGVSSLGSPLMLQGDRNYGREHKFNLPASVSAGVAWHHVFSKTHGLDINADFDWYFIRETGAGIGLGYTYRGIFSVRAGGHYGKSIRPYVSIGAGIRIFDGFYLDAYYLVSGKDSILRDTLGASLRYSLRQHRRR